MDSKSKNQSQKIGSISALEIEIAKIVWEKRNATMRSVHEAIFKKEVRDGKKDFTPYTTVASAVTGMAKKGILEQDRGAKTYLYSANMDRRELSRRLIKSISENIL